MKRILSFLFLLAYFIPANGQSTEDYAVELTAKIQIAPPRIVVQWKRILTDTPTYVIYRKARTATSWGSSVATLVAADSQFVDTTVVADSAYEYAVFANGSTWSSSGYIYAGIKAPPFHNRGAMILMVDSNFTDSCATAITVLMNDLSGDGWQIIRHDVSRTFPDSMVKMSIVNDCAAYPNVTSVLLLGHIAVPYSGNLNPPPDGHVPYHQGAWPADVYYAANSFTWTDAYVVDTLASYTANWNVIGDGKWDQMGLLAPSALQISRVDFYNMPSFGTSESQMMNSYLAKDHLYKMDSLNIRHRGLVCDNFGPFGGEAFAANAWRNFSPLIHRDSVQALPLISSLSSTSSDSSFQWAYGCGGGWFTGAGGVGATTDFAANPVNGIFMMLFGSYFGDWNVQDNFLRAPLCASNPALTNCWAGRPNWFFHHMALGENIGYSAWLTQNNSGAIYSPSNYGARWIHIALMGDLSLRTDYIKQPSNLAISAPIHAGAYLSWTASPDSSVLGYFVYRSDALYGAYQLISPLVSTTSFHDTVGISGLKYYMVKPEKLQNTPSGSYCNLGVGIFDTATVSYSTVSVPMPVAMNNLGIRVFPNPVKNNLNVDITTSVPETISLCLIDESGKIYYPAVKSLKAGDNNFSINVTNLVPGIYQLSVKSGEKVYSQKCLKL